MILYEPFAGSAAVSYHALGHRAVLSYQGGKSRFAKKILQEMGAEKVTQVILRDTGPWNMAHVHLADPTSRAAVLTLLKRFNERDPIELIGEILSTPRSKWPWIPSWATREPITMTPAVEPEPDCWRDFPAESKTARFLYLQRLAFSGKAVGYHLDAWSFPGINITSAYGKEETERFGKINPMVPSLIKRIEALGSKPLPILSYLGDSLESRMCTAHFVYMDPPYLFRDPADVDALLGILSLFEPKKVISA